MESKANNGQKIAPGFPTECTTAGTTEGTESGSTGMDQSIAMGSCKPARDSHSGNSLPPLPPIKRGN